MNAGREGEVRSWARRVYSRGLRGAEADLRQGLDLLDRVRANLGEIVAISRDVPEAVDVVDAFATAHRSVIEAEETLRRVRDTIRAAR